MGILDQFISLYRDAVLQFLHTQDTCYIVAITGIHVKYTKYQRHLLIYTQYTLTITGYSL